MSGEISKQAQPVTLDPRSSSSSTVPVELQEMTPTSLPHGQVSRTTASVDKPTVSDGARDRAPPDGTPGEVKDSAQILNESSERIDHQRVVKPQKRLYRTADFEHDNTLDLGCWAELTDDHGLDLAIKIFTHLLETSELEIHDPASTTNPGVNNANTQTRDLHIRLSAEAFPFSERHTIWTIPSHDTTPSLVALQVRGWIEKNWHNKLEAFGQAARFHLPIVSCSLCKLLF